MTQFVRREILAGLSTFFTVAYLIVLYPQILRDGGIDFGAALTATILVMVLATLFLAIYANFPAVLAPGLTVGPYLIYTIIQKQHATWQTALGIVFWVGLGLFLLTQLKVRQKIIVHLPPSIKYSAIAGIGLYLICVGLKDLNIFIPQTVFFHLGPLITGPNAIAFFGLILFFILHRFQISSAFLISILVCWVLGLSFGLAVWKGTFALPASLSPTFFKLDFLTPLQPEWIGALLSVLLISLIDSTAALTVLSKLAHKEDEKGYIKNINRILLPDGTGSMVAGLLGTGSLSYTLESSSGIKAGGRTGLTAIIAALCCLFCLFLYPLISSIPLFATAPALIAIGIFMAAEAKAVKWRDPTESIPALLTLVTIPLMFNIFQGFVFGFISFVLLKAITGRWKEVHPICWGLGIVFALHLIWTAYSDKL